MREILFRGVRKETGAFIYGHYYKDDTTEKHYIIAWEDGTGRGCLTIEEFREVKQETVGQFTGLTDRNGKKIFEGDIVNAVIVRDLGGGEETRNETGIIGYDTIGMIGLIAKYAGTIPVWSDFFQELTLSGNISDFWFEVIGNIHDNPELIEKQPPPSPNLGLIFGGGCGIIILLVVFMPERYKRYNVILSAHPIRVLRHQYTGGIFHTIFWRFIYECFDCLRGKPKSLHRFP